MLFALRKCDQEKLEEGLKCFKDSELVEYFASFRIQIAVNHNYIDYENIENPVQTINQHKHIFPIDPLKWNSIKFKFQKHIFVDNKSRIQLFGGESQSEFMNLQDISVSQESSETANNKEGI